MTDETVYTFRRLDDSPAVEQWPGWFAVQARDDMQRALLDSDGRGSTVATDFWARRGLVAAEVEGEAFDAMRAPLSRRLFQVLRDWFDKRGWLDDAGHDGTRYSLLHSDDGDPIWGHDATPDPEWTAARVAEQQATRDGMLALDADFADLLEGTHSETGEAYRSNARAALAKGMPAAWARWNARPDLPAQTFTGAELAVHLERGRACKAVDWLAVAIAKTMPQAAPVSFAQVQRVTIEADSYTRAAKESAGLAWATGAGIAVDDDRYSEASDLVRMAPQVMALGVSRAGVPQTRFLSIAIPSRRGFTETAARDASSVLSKSAGKLAVLLFACVPSDGRFLSATLGQLSHLHYAHTKWRKDHLEQTLQALAEVRHLDVVTDTRAVTLFDLDRPIEADPDALVTIGMGRLAALRSRSPEWKRWRGEVVVNLSGLSRMPINESIRPRVYIAAASDWNDSRNTRDSRHGDPRLEASLDELAIRTNTTSGDAQKRIRMADSRKQVQRALDALEGDRMVSLDKKGDRVIVRPTEAHEEAYRKWRSGKAGG